MNGIEKITQKIQSDCQSDIALIQGDAQSQVAQIQADIAKEIAAQHAEILAKGQLRAQERQARLLSAAQMEAKKLELGAKQDVIGEAFDSAIHLLATLDDPDYIALLTRLAVRASTTGNEALIFSQKDRARVGKQVVMAANEALASSAIPELPAALKGSKIGNLIGTAAAKLSGNASLTLSEETRDMEGGFILSDGDVEVNCAFDTLVRLQRDALEGEVAAILFQ